MKKNITIYACIIAAVLGFDRLTKLWALYRCAQPRIINEYMSCEFVVNRGVSWSLLSFADDARFVCVGIVVFLITCLLGVYTWRQYRFGEEITGEVLVLSGSISNLIDRIVYNGVIDFLVLSYGDWSWPVFNVADVAIVVGVCLMVMQLYKK